MLAGLKKAGADAFIYIGGNDTSGTQQILTDAAGGSIAFVHAPKTIDNDLVENDHTPGFISAGEFVAGAFLSVDLDFRALPGVYVGIVMGRHAGFLTAAAAAWRADEDSGPHLVYVPERAFSVPRFIDDVRSDARPPQALHRRRLRGRDDRGRPRAGRKHRPAGPAGARRARQRQAFGQRPGPGLRAGAGRGAAGKARARRRAGLHAARLYRRDQQHVDRSEAFEAGVFAVEVAARGGGSVALKYEGGKTVMRQVPLDAVAGKTRHMPDDFLQPDANQLSETGMAYLKRLVPEKYEVGKPFV